MRIRFNFDKYTHTLVRYLCTLTNDHSNRKQYNKLFDKQCLII